MMDLNKYTHLHEKEIEFLRDIAEEVAILTNKDTASEYRAFFQKQLGEFAEKWKAYTLVEKARSDNSWQPSMGKPHNPLGTIWPSVYWSAERIGILSLAFGTAKYPFACRDVPSVLGCYALLAVIHDAVLPNCPSLISSAMPKQLSRIIWNNLLSGIDIDGAAPIGSKCSTRYMEWAIWARTHKIEKCLESVKKDIEKHSDQIRNAKNINSEDAKHEAPIEKPISIQLGSDKPMQIRSIKDPPELLLEKALTNGWVFHVPVKPFQAGFICQVIDKGLLENTVAKYGVQGLSSEDKDLIVNVCGGVYNLAKLRLYLAQECNISSPDNMQMREILTILKEKHMTVEGTRQEATNEKECVFISYSHKDKKWLKDLQTHLKPYTRNGSIVAWSDEQIRPGSKFLSEIKAAMARTKVAVLLVTPNFLNSDFIHDQELTPLLKQAAEGGVCILWIPIRACAYKQTAVRDLQAVCDPGKPLANMKAAARDSAWVKICEEIKRAAES